MTQHLPDGSSFPPTTMGDKSPKSTKKKADQQQTRTDDAKRKKKAAEDAKRVVPAAPGKGKK